MEPLVIISGHLLKELLYHFMQNILIKICTFY